MQINDVVRMAGGEYARPALFNAYLNIPVTVNSQISQKNYDVLCKSIQLPNFSNEAITIKYMGQDIAIPGRVTTGNRLTVTFMLEEKHRVFIELSEWLRGMDQFHYNTSTFVNSLQKMEVESKLGSLRITPQTWAGDTDITYEFGDLYPISIGGVVFQSDNTSSIIEVTVEFGFLTLDITGVGTGNILDVIEGEFFEFTNELVQGIESGLTNLITGSLNQITPSSTDLFGFDNVSNFTRNIPQYAASTIAKGVFKGFKFSF
jgi:hypothetical protein